MVLEQEPMVQEMVQEEEPMVLLQEKEPMVGEDMEEEIADTPAKAPEQAVDGAPESNDAPPSPGNKTDDIDLLEVRPFLLCSVGIVWTSSMTGPRLKHYGSSIRNKALVI